MALDAEAAWPQKREVSFLLNQADVASPRGLFQALAQELSTVFNAIRQVFSRTDAPRAHAPRVAFVGLSPEGGRDAGGHLITYFGIPDGRELDAGRDIVTSLVGGAEVSLSNDLDEGNEGTTFFRRIGSGMETKVGGHGWQGDWKPIDEAGVLASVAALAPLNRGGHWRKRVSVIRSKKPA